MFDSSKLKRFEYKISTLKNDTKSENQLKENDTQHFPNESHSYILFELLIIEKTNIGCGWGWFLVLGIFQILIEESWFIFLSKIMHF